VAHELDPAIEDADRCQLDGGCLAQKSTRCRACRAVPSALLLLQIHHVGGVRAQKEVVRVHAPTLVAVVTDMHPGRDWPMLELPRPSMGKLCALEVQGTITGAIDARLPDQATGNRIAFGEMGEALFGSPVRRTPQHPPAGGTKIGFHAPNLGPLATDTYYGHWLLRFPRNAHPKFSVH
jgi:hypothetical protein